MLRFFLTATLASVCCVTGAQQQAPAPRPAAPFAPPSNARVQTTPSLFRHANLDQAWRASQASGRPMFLYVTSDNCLYCK